jgi:hypothetical protein
MTDEKIPAELEAALTFSKSEGKPESKNCMIAKIAQGEYSGIPANIPAPVGCVAKGGLTILAPAEIAKFITPNKIYWCILKAMKNGNGYIVISARRYGHTIKLIDMPKRGELVLHISCNHKKEDMSFIFNPTDPEKADYETILDTVESPIFVYSDEIGATNIIEEFEIKAEAMAEAYRKQVIKAGKKHPFSKAIKAWG